MISGFTCLLARISYLVDSEMVSKFRYFFFENFENIKARKLKFGILIDFEVWMSPFLEHFLIWSLLREVQEYLRYSAAPSHGKENKTKSLTKTCDHFVTILWPFSDHFVTILWPFYMDFVTILWPFSHHFVTILWPFYMDFVTIL